MEKPEPTPHDDWMEENNRLFQETVMLRADNKTLLEQATEMAKRLGKERDKNVALRAEVESWKHKYDSALVQLVAWEDRIEVAEYDRDAACGLIEKLKSELAAAVEVIEQIRHYLMGGTWIFDKSPDEFIRAFLARLEVK